MRLRQIDLYLNREPFRFAFVSMHGGRRRASGVIVRLETDSGAVGWGESTPRDYVSGETCESVLALIETHFAPLLFASELETSEQVMGLLDLLEAQVGAPSKLAGPSALGAVDLALWDAWGQVCNAAAYTFFAPAPLPRPPLSLSVPILPPKQIRQLHPFVEGLGVSQFKVVLSGDVEENVARLRVLRELVGGEALLTADANGKLTPEQVLAMLPALRPFRLAAIEQPAPKADLDGLRRLRRSIETPVTVDESLCSLADARRVIALEACDSFNLKLSKCGGLLATGKIHQLACEHNIGCQLGSHVGETAILAAAGKVAVQVFSNLSFMEIGSALLDPASGIGVPDGPLCDNRPGLGLSIDTAGIEARFGPPVVTRRAP